MKQINVTNLQDLDLTPWNNQHLIGIDDLSVEEITLLHDLALNYHHKLQSKTDITDILSGKIILTLFFENSTRTRTSFDMAAKRLGAEVIHWDASTSSLKKGESFRDTITTLNAMAPDAIIIRHSEFGAPSFVAGLVDCPVLNAGDSWNEHPTQALLDSLTIRNHFGHLDGLNIAIIGDIAHSRVAASNMRLLTKMGAMVRIIAPDILIPEKLPAPNIAKFTNLKDGLDNADVIITIRPQKERMESALIQDEQYFDQYGLTKQRVSWTNKENTIVLDPGPFLRNVQISDDLADSDPRFLYHDQILFGVAVRMAALDLLIHHGKKKT